MNTEAERMRMQALKGYKKAWEPEHTSTLDTVNNLGNPCRVQGRLKEAEEIYERALKGGRRCGDQSTRRRLTRSIMSATSQPSRQAQGG
jgi:hypothetical protein